MEMKFDCSIFYAAPGTIRIKRFFLIWFAIISVFFSPGFVQTSLAEPTCTFSAYADGSGPHPIGDFKFWAGMSGSFYEVAISISDAPGNYSVYFVKPDGGEILYLANQSESGIRNDFAASGSLYSGGGYTFRVAPQGVPGTTWCQSDSFFQGAPPTVTVTTSPDPMVVGEQSTVNWSVSGGLSGLPYGGWTGNIRLQWHQNDGPLANLAQIPVTDDSYQFITPAEIAGAV
ncbi:MAG: hypothetical protein GY859_39160, partial [Desulfobacterales bacterium]|nr:hypothetical protein [Desulfobacterales bacterium]